MKMLAQPSFEDLVGPLTPGAGPARAEGLPAESRRSEVGRSEVSRCEVSRCEVGRCEVGRSEVGRSEALRQAYLTHRRSLLGYITRLAAGDGFQAEDVLQETMLRAWRHPELLVQDISTLRPWLFAVARHIVIDRWRARSARPLEILDDVLESRPVTRNEIEELLSRLEVQEAMRRLTPEQIEVIVEIYYRQRSPTETASVLRVPVGTVRSRICYALKTLQAALREGDSSIVAGDPASRASA